MLKYICKRLAAAVVTLFIVMTLAFVVVRLMPGSIYDDPDLPQSVIEVLEEKAHLHDPMIV